MRYYAFVGECVPRTKHFVGLPPELTEGKDERRPLPPARVLVLRPEPTGDVFLYRYSENGSVSGDTWHESLEEAKEQAEFEFGPAVGVWSEVPADIDNVAAFALAQLRRS